MDKTIQKYFCHHEFNLKWGQFDKDPNYKSREYCVKRQFLATKNWRFALLATSQFSSSLRSIFCS